MEASEALIKAIKDKSETLVLQLLQSGAIPALNENEALLLAASSRDCENIIDSLLQYGAEANLKILNAAVMNYNENVIEKLLQHGADASELGVYNQNVLHSVGDVFQDKISNVCEMLIKNGAEVNNESQICRITPLWKAIDRGNNKVIEVLLQYGAQPCREMHAPRGIGVPLEYSFSLKATTIESLIKYAALQVNSSDEKEVQNFLNYIADGRNIDGRRVPNIARKYSKLARDSLGEVNTLKEKILDENRVSLFDFVVSQHDILGSFKGNSNIINRVLDHIISTPFPVYREVIIKKLEKHMIIRKLVETPQCRWGYDLGGIKCFVNTDCMELIADYLSVIDLGNLLIALTSDS